MLTSNDMRRYIAAKRDGSAIAAEAWAAIVEGFDAGIVDDAQMAALAMACVLRGMDRDETAALTRAMADSGERIVFSDGIRCVDKHSTGGVADTVSLIIVPLVAAAGVRVAKLSGRALGHTGGTIDKLEAIPGYRTALSPAEFISQVSRIGCAIAAQSSAFAPADRRLYALRDRTATVPGVGLVVASIVSKKIAGGAEAFVFDVKTGGGAFMPDIAAARELAQALVEVSSILGRPSSAVITDMDEPLGPAIGSGLEAIEAREFLRGSRRDSRLLEVALALGEELLAAGGISGDRRAILLDVLESGAAYAKFCAMVGAQGGDVAALERLAPHARRTDVFAERAGVITGVDAFSLGELARDCVLHSGPYAGLFVRVHEGDAVQSGTLLASVYGEADVAAAVRSAFRVGATAPERRRLVHEIVRFHQSSTAGVS